MSRTRSVRRAFVLAVLVAVLVTACGGSTPDPAPDTLTLQRAEVEEQSVVETITVPDSAAPPAALPAQPAAVPPPVVVPEADPAPEPGVAADRTPVVPDAPAAPATCDVGGAAGAAQVVVVEGSGNRATVTACAQAAGGSYVAELGPFRGYVGRNGVAPRGAKAEGDGRTPSGVFPLRGGFGSRGDPGLAQGWSGVDAGDVWVDDPASALYNTRQRDPADGRWTSAERLLNEPAYTYAQVIGYNEGATPGAGSAIFFHVSTGGSTAGCVSLPTDALLSVLRWQSSGAVMVIR